MLNQVYQPWNKYVVRSKCLIGVINKLAVLMFHSVIITILLDFSDHWEPGHILITLPFSELESGDSWEGDTARQEFWEFWLENFPVNVPGAAVLARWEKEDGNGMKSSPRECLCNSTSTTYKKKEEMKSNHHCYQADLTTSSMQDQWTHQWTHQCLYIPTYPNFYSYRREFQ